MNTKDLQHFIQSNKFIIYGNGHIAHRFYRQLQRMNCEGNVEAVAVTEVPSPTIGVNNQMLREIKTIDKSVPVIIAAHDANAREMKDTVAYLGFEFSVWICPYLFDLEFGEPIKRDIRINLERLIENLPISYNPAIYYLSLKDYCNENFFNGSIYIRTISYFSTNASAKKRWERFRGRIDECLQYGFQQDYNVKVQEDYVLMDGWHCLMLARYFGVKSLLADIYHGSGNYYTGECINGKTLLYEQDLPKYYTDEEIRQIKQADIELRGTSSLGR